jgi:hypothetical protein
MRDQREIQRAHDILVAITLKEVPVDIPDVPLHAIIDALCWELADAMGEKETAHA